MPKRLASILILVLVAVATPAPTHAQEVEKVKVIEEATVYRRPSTDAEVRSTVSVGTVLDVLDRQEGWIAVSTTDGVIGWLQEKATAADTSQPTETRPSAPSSSRTPAASPPPRSGASTTPPPPPPARPPGRSGATPPPAGNTEVARATEDGGLFGTGGWARLGFSATDGEHPGGEIVWTAMLSRIVEFRNSVAMSKRSAGALPGIEKIGSTSSPGNFATEDDPVWDMGIAGALNFYLLQPQGELPLGVHVGGFADWTRYLGSITTSPGDFQTLSYGGEAGVFYRGAKGNVVRGAIQFGQIQYRSDLDPVSESVVNIMVGLEPKLGPVQFGAYGGQHNNQRFLKVAIIFP